jgi:hypothetical protein
MLCHYGGTIILDVNSSITYNGGSSVLLNTNLGMSNAKMKKKLYVMDLSEIIMILKLI